MTTASERIGSTAPPSGEPEPPSFTDAIRFLYDRRVRFVARFVLFLGIGAIAFILWLWRSPRVVEGRVALLFSGIEHGSYPSGKAFTVEDFRAADVLRAAAADAGLPADTDLSRLSANFEIAPVIPSEVLARWRRQDRDGAKREEFAPSLYQIQIHADRAFQDRSVRLFDAAVNRYRAKAKLEQKAALRFVDDYSVSDYAELLKKYDYWEVPHILEQNVLLLQTYLDQLVKESGGYENAGLKYSFRELVKELFLWKITRLEALKGVTFRGKLVRDKDTALLSVQYRIEDLDIAAREANQETAEAMRLLEAAQKPQQLAAAQGSGRDAIPIVDSAVIERLTKSDYISPLVQHISELQSRAKELEASRSRLEKDLVYLQQARNIQPEQLPASYRSLIDTVSSELREILRRYNKLLDAYLTDHVTSLVAVRDGPRLVRGVSPATVALTIVVLSAVLGLLAVLAEQLIHKALSG